MLADDLDSAAHGIPSEDPSQTAPKSLPALVLVQLTNLLVKRPQQELQGVCRDGYDGSSSKMPFYGHPGVRQFLQDLASDPRCVLAVMTTRLTSQTCEPIMHWLRQEANLDEHGMLLFDVTSMCDHEDHSTDPDGRLIKQCNLERICEECYVAYGRPVDFHRSIAVVTELAVMPRDHVQHAMQLHGLRASHLMDGEQRLHASAALAKVGQTIRKRLQGSADAVLFLEPESELVPSTPKPQQGYRLPTSNLPDGAMPLLAVDLNCLLLFRSETGLLQGGSLIGYDGTSSHRPFYANPGTAVFVQMITSNIRCIFAVMTSMQPRSCKPMLDWLRQETGLCELMCFDASSMCLHERQITFDDGRPKRQRNFMHLCDKCEAKGITVDRDKSVLVVSEYDSVQSCDAKHVFLLPSFAADDVVDPKRQSLAAEELVCAYNILTDHLSAPALPDCWPEVPCQRAMRTVEDQRNRPPASIQTFSGTEWLDCGRWACADGVTACGSQVSSSSKAKGWAGARLMEPVEHGACSQTSVRVLAGTVVRVGWAARCAREVGVDRWGYGYGGTAKKSHNRRYLDYGKPFGVGDVVTSVLDRTGEGAEMKFLLNGKPVAEEPAFHIPEEWLTGPSEQLFFAVCGTPCFKVELLTLTADATVTHSIARNVVNQVERHGYPTTEECRTHALYTGRVLVLCFNRHPQQADDALLNSELARRATDRGADLQPSWANGAKIFVEHLTSADVEESRVELQPRHVIVREDEEHYVYEALEGIPYKVRPRLKPTAGRAIVPDSNSISRFRDADGSNGGDDDDEVQYDIVVRGTFITIRFQPEISPRSMKTWP